MALVQQGDVTADEISKKIAKKPINKSDRGCFQSNYCAATKRRATQNHSRRETNQHEKPAMHEALQRSQPQQPAQKIMRFGFSVALTAAAFACGAVHAASFDCAKAQTRVEKLTCSDAELSKLDEDLAATYTKVSKTEVKKIPIQRQQRDWLKSRNQCADVVCLKHMYSQRIDDLNASPLKPFNYMWDNMLPEQRETPVCKDFRNYLNRSRSNALFKPDGTLVRESEEFQSVQWETLDKPKFRSGFADHIEVTRVKQHPKNDQSAREFALSFMDRYDNPQWVLQRTQAYPFEYHPKPGQKQRWLFRLVTRNPHTRIFSDLNSKVELPTWFHNDDESYLGYEDGSILENNNHHLGRTSSRQWVVYGGHMYAISNRTPASKTGTIPPYLRIDIDQLNVDPSGQSFMHYICAFRAKNDQ